MPDTIRLTVIAGSPAEAIEKAMSLLDRKVPGFSVSGDAVWRDEPHKLVDVIVYDDGGSRDDLWFWTTSYGMSPEQGTSSFGDSLDRMAGA